MKQNLRKLQLLFLLTRLTEDMFYSITVTEYDIRMQGRYSQDKLEAINGLFKTYTSTAPRDVDFIRRHKIQIFLTK